MFNCLRKTFTLKKVPPVATLYAAGPHYIRVYLNGKLLAAAERDAKDRLRPFLLAIDVSGQMRAGRNLIALTVSGDRLVLKIVPAPLQAVKPALLLTDTTWKCGDGSSKGWESLGFDDRSWPAAISLGGIESSSEFFERYEDAGMYRWPGYDGISPFLAHAILKAEELTYGFEGMGKFSNSSALMRGQYARALQRAQSARAYRGRRSSPPRLPAKKLPQSEYPFLVLGFRKECTGRLRVVSDSPAPMRLEVQYGESAEEALIEPLPGGK